MPGGSQGTPLRRRPQSPSPAALLTEMQERPAVQRGPQKTQDEAEGVTADGQVRREAQYLTCPCAITETDSSLGQDGRPASSPTRLCFPDLCPGCREYTEGDAHLFKKLLMHKLIIYYTCKKFGLLASTIHKNQVKMDQRLQGRT